jgi:hypothetical protein
MVNVLRAIQSVVERPIPDLLDRYQGKNRINNVGDALEILVKDIFAGTLDEADEGKKIVKYEQIFSYLGNQNNPPDAIVKNGDAIEVKKIESFKAGIHLNSSYPKSKLVRNDPMITDSCRIIDGGNWQAKDLIYIIGVVKQRQLKRLWFLLGDCYAADRDIYERIKTQISSGIRQIPGVEFSDTKELGRVNKIDPLGVTYLRIRGMWGIENPVNVYHYLNLHYNENAYFQTFAILTAKKYFSCPRQDIDSLEQMAQSNANLEIADVKIQSPNNPAQLIDAKLITYTSLK